ncbi:Fruiting body protein [Sparassis crispa]|uniref:Hydrophobin n=1 Tax=Sparassis crispa TaxID=139825 RepID=A0A401GU04_9APHY|nr:Fruiting body protein [Sparassis crispa]GBE85711.1 Fruiting body protein [Sparassis crispa]
MSEGGSQRSLFGRQTLVTVKKTSYISPPHPPHPSFEHPFTAPTSHTSPTHLASTIPPITMFALRTLAVLALAAAALARPQSSSQCDSGSIACCDSTYDPESYEAQFIMKALNIDQTNLPAGKVATSCGGGISNVGGGSTCANIPVCCENNTFNGLVNFGCTSIPIIL